MVAPLGSASKQVKSSDLESEFLTEGTISGHPYRLISQIKSVSNSDKYFVNEMYDFTGSQKLISKSIQFKKEAGLLKLASYTTCSKERINDSKAFCVSVTKKVCEELSNLDYKSVEDTAVKLKECQPIIDSTFNKLHKIMDENEFKTLANDGMNMALASFKGKKDANTEPFQSIDLNSSFQSLLTLHDQCYDSFSRQPEALGGVKLNYIDKKFINKKLEGEVTK